MSDAGLLLVGAAMLAGVVGVVVPVLPGLVLTWAAGLGWALLDDNALRWPAFAVMTVLLAGGTVAKYLLPKRRLDAVGAPRSTLVLGAAGAVVGFFAVPVVGFLVGAVAGVLLAELHRNGAWAPAWRSTRHVLVAIGLGMVLELSAALAVFGVWVAALVVA